MDAQLQERLEQIRLASEERIAKMREEFALRREEVKGNALIMSRGMEAAMSPVPDALPGEVPNQTTQTAAPAAPM